MKILVTGSAGFIGFHLVNKLLPEGFDLVGLDNINDYYDLKLKFDRLNLAGIKKESIVYNKIIASKENPGYRFIQLNLEDDENLFKLFQKEKFDVVCNLAAQAGVRYSISNPKAYINSNIAGFLNILESCRHNNVKHLVYASSSSVYGLNLNMPFSVKDNVDHPISLYAASKKSNELMAHCYSHLYNLPTTGLRFFTVYGPWGRPDMALFLFTKAIINGEPLEVYNNGEMERDFTYIDDIVEGLKRIIINKPPERNNSWSGISPDPACSSAPYKIYNIGNSSPVKLIDFISEIEKAIGKKAVLQMKPLQAGDVIKTCADVENLKSDYNYKPSTTISYGIQQFIGWYLKYYSIKPIVQC